MDQDHTRAKMILMMQMRKIKLRIMKKMLITMILKTSLSHSCLTQTI